MLDCNNSDNVRLFHGIKYVCILMLLYSPIVRANSPDPPTLELFGHEVKDSKWFITCLKLMNENTPVDEVLDCFEDMRNYLIENEVYTPSLSSLIACVEGELAKSGVRLNRKVMILARQKATEKEINKIKAPEPRKTKT